MNAHLLDTLKLVGNLKNDNALAIKLRVRPPAISKM